MYTLCLPVYRVCAYCLHECLVCATMSFRPLAPPNTSGRARMHELHVPIIACKFDPRAWSFRAAGLALDQPCFLVGCVVVISF